MPPRYRKLAALYFFYFASFGIYLPYWAPYLQSLKFSATEIGKLLAIFMATKVFAPYLWGWAVDRSGQRLKMLRIAAVLSVLFYAVLLMHGGSYTWLVATTLLYSFFFNAWLPQLESITLGSLRYMADNYSKIRLWGSVGFIIFTLGAVPIIHRYGLAMVPYLMFFTIILMWLVSLYCDDRQQYDSGDHGSRRIAPLLIRPEVLALGGLCFVVQLSHSPYYAFFSIYLSDAGYGKMVIGLLWSLGVIAEIAVFIIIPRLLPNWTEPVLLTFSTMVTALRWFLIAWFPQQLPVIVFAQTLHAISFGVYHAAAIKLVNRWFPGNLQARGQAIYLSVSFGVGGGVGMLVSGYLWDQLGGSVLFLVAGCVAVAGMLLTIPLHRWLRLPGA